MVLVLSQDSLVRRNGEDELVRLIERAEAVPSYSVLHEQQLESEDEVKKAVADSGVEGIIVMRPVYDRERSDLRPRQLSAALLLVLGILRVGLSDGVLTGLHQERSSRGGRDEHL